MNTDLSSSDCDRHCSDPDEDADQSVDVISHEFNQKIDLESNNDSTSQSFPDLDHIQEDNHEQEEDNHDEDEHEDNDDDFTFMLIGDDDEHINYDDKVFEDGKIRPVFPLFDRNLLLDGEYHIEEIDQLPVHPPVDKIFIESPRGYPSSKPSENEQNADDATGPYCEWSKDSVTATTSELNKKSNSTGFSKLWRLREIVGRSNSDGRDAFVFLKGNDRSTAAATTSKAVTGDGNGNGTFVKVNVAGGKARVVKQGMKTKKSTVSAHEAYLKSRGGHTEEERRRSYLPYRPELMGLFTNVHGGLSKNVHPY